MRFPTLSQDFWELASAEQLHREHPDTFLIPPREARVALERGRAVKLLFLVEGENEDGTTSVQAERMWVLVAERRAGGFVGILESAPTLFDGRDAEYLVRGAEVPFGAEHVIDIGDPPAGYLTKRLEGAPTRHWPQEDHGQPARWRPQAR